MSSDFEWCEGLNGVCGSHTNSCQTGQLLLNPKDNRLSAETQCIGTPSTHRMSIRHCPKPIPAVVAVSLALEQTGSRRSAAQELSNFKCLVDRLCPSLVPRPSTACRDFLLLLLDLPQPGWPAASSAAGEGLSCPFPAVL